MPEGWRSVLDKAEGLAQVCDLESCSGRGWVCGALSSLTHCITLAACLYDETFESVQELPVAQFHSTSVCLV